VSLLNKSREPLRRPRRKSRLQSADSFAAVRDTLLSARRVAYRFVAAHWPDLADVEPQVAQRVHFQPDPALLAELGLDPQSLPAAPDDDCYIFTFSGTIRTPDGFNAPRVASVTVDAHQRVLRSTMSK
jgi:hypothetical protein